MLPPSVAPLSQEIFLWTHSYICTGTYAQLICASVSLLECVCVLEFSLSLLAKISEIIGFICTVDEIIGPCWFEVYHGKIGKQGKTKVPVLSTPVTHLVTLIWRLWDALMPLNSWALVFSSLAECWIFGAEWEYCSTLWSDRSPLWRRCKCHLSGAGFILSSWYMPGNTAQLIRVFALYAQSLGFNSTETKCSDSLQIILAPQGRFGSIESSSSDWALS